MRLPSLTILFTVVLSGIVICSGLFAANWFWAKTAPDIADVEEIRATLQSLVPSEAEAKAIAQLRQKMQETTSCNIPLQATENPDARLSVEVRFLRGCLEIGIVSSAFMCYTYALFHSGAEL